MRRFILPSSLVMSAFLVSCGGSSASPQEQVKMMETRDTTVTAEPPPACGPIDEWADQRRDEQERGETDRKEQHHAGPRRCEVNVEEQRVSECDDHRCVATHHQRMSDR